jgi:hypothetical protein
MELIIQIDSNAHHGMWGSDHDDDRGRTLVDFILNNNLLVQNCNDKPTYRRLGQGQGVFTHIDVTVTNRRGNQLITDWDSDFETQSDHALITMDTNILNPGEVIPNPKTTRWKYFRKDIKKTEYNPIPSATEMEIENYATEQLRHILHTLNNNTRNMRVRKNKDPFPWWDDECQLNQRAVYEESKRVLRNPARGREELSRLRNIHAHTKRKKRDEAYHNYVNSLVTAKTVARLCKPKKPPRIVGLLSDGDPREVIPHTQTLNVLLNEHMPDSRIITEEDRYTPNKDKRIYKGQLRSHKTLTLRHLKLAIAKLAADKKGGPDNITVKIMKNLPDNALERLLELMTYSYTMEFIPSCWSESDMIFLGKPGKKDMSHKRAYRPITLSSFIIKLMERLFLWDVEQDHFSNKPMHPRQHGFTRGRSCDSALAETLDCIESGYHQGDYVLALFFDIKGAFDNLLIAPAQEAMRRRGIPNAFIRWYQHYLDTRVVFAEIHGEKQMRQPKRGFPQGGVFSPTFYNISGEAAMFIVNEIDRIGGPGTASQLFREFGRSCNGMGLADDTNAILRGKDIFVLFEKMQQIINALLNWAHEYGLTFCEEKTRFMLFTKQARPKNLPVLNLEDQIIKEYDHKRGQRYLGVWFDHKLTFKIHIDLKIQAAKQKLAIANTRISKKYGPNPKMRRYIFESVIKPAITYAAHIWAHKLTDKHRTELHSLCRTACLLISSQVGNAPTDGLEAILGVMPLDIAIESTAVNTYLNTKGSYQTFWGSTNQQGKRIGFRHAMETLTHKYYPEGYKDDRT